jgi:uncharacterized protein YqeY
MSLLDRLNQDIKQAMKNKDKERLTVMRMVKSSLQNEAIKFGKELSDDEELQVLTREMKQRKDSLHEFENAGRDDLVNNINNEVAVLNDYMPKQMSEEELKAVIQETIDQTGASSKADIGKVMGAIMPKIRGQADGTVVNRLVQQLLSS